MISVIIPAWNNWAMTHKCLSGLRATLPKSAEVILVDNGSTDCTPSEVARLHPGVRVVRHEENLGFARGSNSGLKAARCELVCFLNNDTELIRGWWRTAATRLHEEKDLGAVGGLLLNEDRRTVNHLGIAFTDQYRDPVPRLPLPCHLYRNARVRSLPKRALISRDLQAVTGACMMMRRDVALSLDGFHEGFLNGFEDVDLCFRLRFELGMRVSLEPNMKLIHAESRTPGRFDYETENAILFDQRWGGRVIIDAEDMIRSDLYGSGCSGARMDASSRASAN